MLDGHSAMQGDHYGLSRAAAVRNDILDVCMRGCEKVQCSRGKQQVYLRVMIPVLESTQNDHLVIFSERGHPRDTFRVFPKGLQTVF